MKLVIKSPGPRLHKDHGATVQTEDGHDLPGVQSVLIDLDCQRASKAVVRMVLPDVDIVADGEVFVTAIPSGRRFRLVPIEDAAKGAA